MGVHYISGDDESLVLSALGDPLHACSDEAVGLLAHGEGYTLPLVTARGPLCTAVFVRGTTNSMIEIVEKIAVNNTIITVTPGKKYS